MTREEILQIAKPILFNTDMVRAILDDRKSVTRRVIKLKYDNTHHEMFTNKYGTRLIEIENDVSGVTFGKRDDGTTWRRLRGFIEPKAPYKRRDYLYVRETWSELSFGYVYKAHGDKIDHLGNLIRWRPSIHMPKEAARIFLKVTDVRVEQLQDIDVEGCKKEGIWDNYQTISEEYHNMLMKLGYPETFKKLWDSTIPKKDLDKYGWKANPWVWVIEFERVEVE